MKKGIKLTTAALLGASAVIPVAVAADEVEEIKDGIYTAGEFIPVEEFRDMNSTKKAEILTDENAVYVFTSLDNEKQAISANLIVTGSDKALDEALISAEQYAEDNNVEFTDEGLVGEGITVVTVENVSATTEDEVTTVTASVRARVPGTNTILII